MEPKGFKHSKQSLLERFQRNRLMQLSELRKEKEFCDLTLKCEDLFEVKVHKFVVSSASNYFKDLLTLPMKEKHEECISLPGITEDVLEKIITFIYTGEFEEEIDDVEKIIKYAVIFQLEELVEICSLVLSESITDHTCAKYWRLARNNLIYGLEDNCLAYIATKADYLFDNSFLNNLTIEEMKSLLSQDSLHSKYPEQMIFEHVWSWAAGQVTDTKKFSEVFSEVVDLFKFSELKDEFVYSRIFLNDDLLDNAELLKKVAKLTNVKHTHMLQKEANTKTSTGIIFPKRKLLGLASNKLFTGLEKGNTTVQIEKKLPPNFSYTTFGTNFLLICGGVESSSCEYLDPTTQEWKKFPSMKKERSSHTCTYFDNKIYACGGLEDGAESKSIEIFELDKGEWCNGPEMISNCADFGLTAVNGALYAFKDEKNVEIFDPLSQNWSVVTYQNQYYTSQQKRYKQCIANGPYIYCCNGEMRHKFDTRSNEMIEQISCTDFDEDFSVCELGNCLYSFGYKQQPENKCELKFVQNQLTGTQIYTETVEMDDTDLNKTALVALYY